MAILERIIGIIAPHECIVCAQEGSLLCQTCADEMLSPVPSRCYRCKAVTENHATCVSCRRSSVLTRVNVRTEYGEVAKKLLHKIKFERARAGAQTVAHEISRCNFDVGNYDIIVPVPTASVRRRQRGYDQSILIAEILGRAQQVSVQTCLLRIGNSRQVGTKRAARKEQMKNAFVVWGDVRGKRILLVDDVVTTGATLESAARALRQDGAKNVGAVVFAAA